MPKCRICDSKIDAKSSVCPVCGCPNPCDSKTKTVDLTLNISDVIDNVDFHYKSKKKAALLTMFLDFIGLGTRYRGYNMFSWLIIAINVVVLIGTYFLASLLKINVILAYVGVIVLIFAINIIRGLVILFTDSTDANGDILE